MQFAYPLFVSKGQIVLTSPYNKSLHHFYIHHSCKAFEFTFLAECGLCYPPHLIRTDNAALLSIPAVKNVYNA